MVKITLELTTLSRLENVSCVNPSLPLQQAETAATVTAGAWACRPDLTPERGTVVVEMATRECNRVRVVWDSREPTH